MNKLKYQQIKTQSGTVGYSVCGAGQPLVLIVGFTGTLFHWHEKFIRGLAENFTVYMVDNRKVGLSDSKNKENLTGLAHDIADFITALQLVKPVVFGWSMGGVIAQELALLQELGGLVLMATVPNMQVVNPEFSKFVAASGDYNADEYRARLYYYFFSRQPTPETKDSISKNAVKLENYHYRFNAEARSLQQKIIPVWSGMSTEAYRKFKLLPTLVLWAKDDLVVPEEAQNFIFNGIHNAKLIIYPSGGHFMIHANPQQIAQDVNNFYVKKKSI